MGVRRAFYHRRHVWDTLCKPYLLVMEDEDVRFVDLVVTWGGGYAEFVAPGVVADSLAISFLQGGADVLREGKHSLLILRPTIHDDNSSWHQRPSDFAA